MPPQPGKVTVTAIQLPASTAAAQVLLPSAAPFSGGDQTSQSGMISSRRKAVIAIPGSSPGESNPVVAPYGPWIAASP
jgi:hypothetical protein